MTIGKGILSLKKDSAIKESAFPNVGFVDVVFAHEATAGETSIPLGDLNVPTTMTSVGFTNPSSLYLLGMGLSAHKNNVSIISSTNGMLQNWVDYLVGNNEITFLNGYAPTTGEIFTVNVGSSAKTGNPIVNASPIVMTGVLKAGVRDFDVGQAFTVNKNPNTQLGDVLVYYNGVLQMRNVGNATSEPAADGNYEEVSVSGEYSTTIRFNNAPASDTAVTVVSNGPIAEMLTDTQWQYLKQLAAQIDAMAPTVAALAGVPVSTFQAVPNDISLIEFGKRVTALENSTFWVAATKTTSFTVSAAENIFVCDATSAQIDVTLPNPGLETRRIDIKKIDASANKVVINPFASETIDGNANFEITAQYTSITVVNDGTNWYII